MIFFKKYLQIFMLLSIITVQVEVEGQVISQWRGIDRNGIYHEENLLQRWPDIGR